jgi:DNA polymerase/3'-5' exonuclease PolX
VLNAGSPIDCDTALRLLADATPARPATVIAITPAASDAALRALAEAVPRVSETPARMALVRAALYEGASSTTAVPTPVSTPAAPAAVTVLVRRLVGILNEQQHHHSGRDDDAAAPVQPRRVIFVLPEWVPASVEAAAQAIAAGSAPALAVVTQTGARAGLRAAVPLRKTPLDVAARLGEEPARKPPRPTVDELGDSVSPTNAKRKSEQAAAGGYLPLFFPTVAAGSAAAAGSEARASPSRPVTPVSDNGGSTSRRLRPFSASLAAAHAAAVRDAARAEQEAAPPVVSAAPLEWSAPPEVVVPRALVDVAAKSPRMAVEAAPIAAVAHSPFLSAAQQRTVAYLDRTQFFACQRAAPTNTTTEQYVGTSAPREGSWLVRALSTAPHATSASTSSGPPTALAGGRAISVAETDFGSLRAASSVHLEPGSPVKIGDRSSRANRTRDDDVFAVPEPPGAARDDDEAADDDAEAMAHLESVLHGRPAAGSPASIPWMPSESPAPRHPGDSAPLVNWPPPREPASTVPDGWHPILLGGSLLQGYDPTAHSARSAASSTSAGSSSSSAGGKLNAHLIKELGELHRIYQSTGDHWREYSYRRAMAVLAKFPVEITDAHKQLADVRGIGDKIRLKIAEILERGTSRKLEALKARPEVAGLDVLTNIFGVGPATAKKLMGLGVYSIDALRTNAAALATLTAPQQLGVRHYEDLLERIPRGEVTRIQNVVVRALEHLGYNVRVADEWNDPTDAAASSVSGRAEAGGLQTGGEPAPVGAATAPSTLTTMAATRRTSASRSRHGGRRGVVDVVTCGSYRRGKASSGDVDILVCERSGSYGDALLPFILDALRHDTAAQGGGGDAGKLEGDDHYDLFETLTAHGDSGTAHGSSTSAMVAAAAGSAARGEVHDSRTWLGVVRLAPNAARPLQDDAPPVELDRPTANRVRRLDIKCYDPESFPFAVLYFTGSDYFNRSMRLYASKRGFSLSDRNLRPVVRVRALPRAPGGSSAGAVVHAGPPVACATERDIFAALGLPYRTPAERDLES